MTDIILTINAGSSSIKFATFALGCDGLGPLAAGHIDGIGGAATFSAQIVGGRKTEFALDQSRGKIEHKAATRTILDWLQNAERGARVVAVGHRVVHGGPDYAEPLLVDRAGLDILRGFAPLAPLHQPHNIAGIEAALDAFPDAAQIACFDTAFHRTHSYTADTFALPRRFYDEGVRRYGFHGLSYEFISRRLRVVAPDLAAGRVIVAHLGNGASMCAMREGRSVASTMGFTALDGLPMGTRCGQLDPGVVLYLMTEKKMSAKAISDLLYQQSGLKGLSGLSNDMRVLEASDDAAAKDAIAYFVFCIRRGIGDLAATLGGVDAIVFTGGIGEKAWRVREAILSEMGWIGVRLDGEANRENAQVISGPGSPVTVFVLQTDEERMIAEHAADAAGLLGTGRDFRSMKQTKPAA
jgi:acetate kinase